MAQPENATDWIAAYKKYVNPTPLVTGHRGASHPRSTAHDDPDQSAYGDEKPDTQTAASPHCLPHSRQGPRPHLSLHPCSFG